MDFTYSENYKSYEDILDRKVIDCLCKHVIKTDTDKSQRLAEVSRKIGVPHVYWGYPDGLHEHPEMNRQIQLGCIQHGITSKNIKPMRVVLTENRRVWIDNLHTAIQNIIIFGEDVTIGECIPYICDMTVTPFKIVNIEGSVAGNLGMAKGAIQAAVKRLNRVHPEMYEIGYTIRDFMEENNINREALTISQKRIDMYKKGQ